MKQKKTLKLIKKYKLENKNIFVTPWLPFKERENYLTECDAGIVTAPNIPEANLFLKTRIYDYLWAQLPVILGDNEAFASFIAQMKLGLVAKCASVEDFAEKIIELESNKNLQASIIGNIKQVKKELSWKKTLKNLEKYFKNPYNDKQKYKPLRKLYKENIKNNINKIK
jgi:glycosyltransferase involved in cell wall biosynthesis